MKHNLPHPLSLAFALFFLLFPFTAALVLAQDDSDSQEPRLLRCVRNNSNEFTLYGFVEAHTEIELIAVTGTARCTATVPPNSSEIVETMEGPVDITHLGRLPQCGMPEVAVAVTTPGLEFQALPIPPLYPGYDALPFLGRSHDAVLAEGEIFSGYRFDETARVKGYLNLAETGIPLNMLRYQVDDISGGTQFEDAELLVAIGPVIAQAFPLGCNDPQHKLFRLGSRLYLMNQWNSCTGDESGFELHIWSTDQFLELIPGNG